MTTEEKAAFLQQEFPQLLAGIDPQAAPRWGKMNLQQMVEHMSDALRMANGRDLYELMSPIEHLPKLQEFVRGDKPFRENTKAPFLGEEPAPLRWDSVNEALGELRGELLNFEDLFLQDKQKTVTNPVFGDLNYEDWVLLLYKHAWHHLRQFGVEPAAQSGTLST